MKLRRKLRAVDVKGLPPTDEELVDLLADWEFPPPMSTPIPPVRGHWRGIWDIYRAMERMGATDLPPADAVVTEENLADLWRSARKLRGHDVQDR